MYKNLKIILLVCVGCISASGYSKTIKYGGDDVFLKIPFSEQTILRFPHAVKTITRANHFRIEPANEKEPDYSVLKISPRFTKSKGKIIFLLADGTIVKANISTVESDLNAEGYYDFQQKDEDEKPVATVKADISELELLKAMIRGRQANGYRIKKIGKKLQGRENDLNLYLSEVYIGKRYTGYIYKLINLSKVDKYRIDVRQLRIGNKNRAIMSSVERTLLKPDSESNSAGLWVVVKSGNRSAKLSLPFEVIKSKNKEESK